MISKCNKANQAVSVLEVFSEMFGACGMQMMQ
jgi:hypothetical protein